VEFIASNQVSRAGGVFAGYQAEHLLSVKRAEIRDSEID
jgi:hypothetical protein